MNYHSIPFKPNCGLEGLCLLFHNVEWLGAKDICRGVEVRKLHILSLLADIGRDRTLGSTEIMTE